MTVHFYMTGGCFKDGNLVGLGKKYVENPDTGSGEIYIGNFNKNGNLEDVNAEYITYTETIINKYVGPMENGVMNGTFDILTYTELGNPENINPGYGNGNGGMCGRKWIANSNAQNRLSGIKRSAIFSDDSEISELSNVQQFMLLTVSQKKFKNRYLFDKFDIIEN